MKDEKQCENLAKLGDKLFPGCGYRGNNGELLVGRYFNK